MGCDGGSIPRREELVQLKKNPEKADEKELERIKWTSCTLSKEPLRTPIVACELGFLYNKEAVLKHLIDKSIPETFSHIKSLKDLVHVNFKENTDFKALGEKQNTSVFDLAEDSPFVCPITGLLVGSNHKFSVLKTCGCVFSDRALRECPSEACLMCNKPFTPQDVLILNPDEEELKVLKQKLKERKSSEKKEKKSSATNSAKRKADSKNSQSNSKRKLDSSSGTTTTSTASASTSNTTTSSTSSTTSTASVESNKKPRTSTKTEVDQVLTGTSSKQAVLTKVK